MCAFYFIKKEKLFDKASELRRRGFSLREISERLGISKSTASIWVSKINISKSGVKRMAGITEKAKKKSSKFSAEKKKEYLKKINKNCSVFEEEAVFSKNDLKIFLALLFWCEGSKKERRLSFINSDPELIKAYLATLRKAFNIDNSKLKALLHLHEYHNREESLKFWSKITKIKIDNISIYNKKNTGVRKRNDYMGCIQVRYGDVKILDELFLIVERYKKFMRG